MRQILALILMLVILTGSFSKALGESPTAEGDNQRFVVMDVSRALEEPVPIRLWGNWRGNESILSQVDANVGEVFVLVDEAMIERPWEFQDQNLERVVASFPAGETPEFIVRGEKPVRFMYDESFIVEVEDAREEFWRARRVHYRRLADAGIPGSQWFRFQEENSAAQLLAPVDSNENRRWNARRFSRNELEDSYTRLTGGRALEENLQVDVDVTAESLDPRKVELSTIEGITVKEMEWPTDLNPEKDQLAKYIPSDNLAVFFPSFEALVNVDEKIKQFGNPIFNLSGDRAETLHTKEKYENQLNLHLGPLVKFLGDALITEIAFTTDDLYFMDGTGVGVLFQGNDIEQLNRALGLRFFQSEFEEETGTIEGIEYMHIVSELGANVYQAATDDAVLITNSKGLLERMIQAGKGQCASIGDLDEYSFMRDRYPRNAEGEAAFALLSDAAIRKWCSPRWRILQGRRRQAAAMMMRLAGEHHSRIIAPRSTTDLRKELFAAGIREGEFVIGNDGVSHTVYGDLEFLTPIAELDGELVTSQERNAYGTFRTRYQNRWRQFFDPIAISIKVVEDTFELDTTVMPLILGSDYNEMIEFAGTETFDPMAGDLHPDALLHFIVHVNKESRAIQSIHGLAQMYLNTSKPLEWIGEYIEVYIDQDEIWSKLLNNGGTEIDEDEFWRHSFELPLLLRIDVSSGFGLTVFLTAVKGFLDSAAPDLVAFSQEKYGENTIVSISFDDSMADQFTVEPAIHYVADGQGLAIALKRSMLERYLDRRGKPVVSGDDLPSTTTIAPEPWLGGSYAVAADGMTIRNIQKLQGSDLSRWQTRRSFDNIPILNEWKRLYPGKDPVAVHNQLYHSVLYCPGEEGYRWNDEWMTMESVVLGNPDAPSGAETLPSLPLNQIDLFRGGVTFEENGLRARARFEIQDE